MAAPHGMRNGRVKHSDELIEKIRGEYFPCVMGYRKLAKKYGISVHTIRDWCTYATRRSAEG